MLKHQQLKAIGELLGDCRAHLDVCIFTAGRFGLDDLANALAAAADALARADDVCHQHYKEAQNDAENVI